eukprot:scaffold106376_cov41-Attheya_sp.AAC.1
MFPQTTQGHDSDTGESATRTNRARGTNPGRATGSRKRPTGPHNHKKVVVLGSMLGPSALFNTGYRHGANGDGKEPRSVPVLRLTFCFAALVVLHESTVRNVPHEASKSKKCDDKATDMAQTYIMDTNHNTETA